MRRPLAVVCSSLALVAAACAREAAVPDAALRARIREATGALDDARLRDADSDDARQAQLIQQYVVRRIWETQPKQQATP